MKWKHWNHHHNRVLKRTRWRGEVSPPMLAVDLYLKRLGRELDAIAHTDEPEIERIKALYSAAFVLLDTNFGAALWRMDQAQQHIHRVIRRLKNG